MFSWLGSRRATSHTEGTPIVPAASLFNQLLQHFPRTEFAALVNKHNAERAAKGFTCWTQFVSMLFCQLGRADSLREICHGLECCLGKLAHLGIAKAPRRSTLAYANAHRPAKLFEELFWTALNRFREQGALGPRQHKFRFNNKLLSLDSTTITLSLSLFSWAHYRRAKGGVKAHVLLDHDDYLPRFVLLTEARRSDVQLASAFALEPGSIVAMDRGYTDYALFGRWSEQGVYFVTRLKDDAQIEVVEERTPPARSAIIKDQLIRLTSPAGQRDCPHTLRRVLVWDVERERVIDLLTNHLGFGATTLSAIYKERWQIELFFKALKQNLTVKSYVGTSENALRIQIWTALISLLLLKWLHHLSRANWSLSVLAAMLRLNLFTYRQLQQWLDDPPGTPPIAPAATQLALDFV